MRSVWIIVRNQTIDCVDEADINDNATKQLYTIIDRTLDIRSLVAQQLRDDYEKFEARH